MLEMQDFCKSDISWLFLWITPIIAVYCSEYGSFMEILFRLLGVCCRLIRVLLWYKPAVCELDLDSSGQAAGVYSGRFDQGGVSPVTTAQNKKTLPSPTDSVRCVTPTTRLRVIGTPFSWSASHDHIRSGRADAKLDRPTNSFGNGRCWFFVSWNAHTDSTLAILTNRQSGVYSQTIWC